VVIEVESLLAFRVQGRVTVVGGLVEGMGCVNVPVIPD
jgi:hypothetical protein